MHKISLKNRKLIIIILVVICIAITLIILPEKYRNIIITIITSIAALAVFFEIKENKDLATGQFIFDLEQSFENNKECSKLFIKCWEDTSNGKELHLENDKEAITSYLTFFESMYILYKKEVINIELLDDLFGRRFFSIVNNRFIQEADLIKNYKYYLNIYNLHAKWKYYRINHDNAELFSDNYHDSIDDIDKTQQFKDRFVDLEVAFKRKVENTYDEKLYKQIYESAHKKSRKKI